MKIPLEKIACGAFGVNFPSNGKKDIKKATWVVSKRVTDIIRDQPS